MHTRYRLLHISVVDARHEQLLTTLQRCKAAKHTLHCFQLKISLVWNGIWKKILVWNGIWNGRFLVWNGNEMEENWQYGVRKNRLPFHSIPCPDCFSVSSYLSRNHKTLRK